MKKYYAELNTSFEIKPDDVFAGTYLQNVGIHGGVDLHRFDSLEKRKEFISEHPDNANTILAADAKKEHGEQFLYWKHH